MKWGRGSRNDVYMNTEEETQLIFKSEEYIKIVLFEIAFCLYVSDILS